MLVVDIMKKGEQMLSQNLEMTKSFTPQEGNTKKLIANQENMSKVGNGCFEKKKGIKKMLLYMKWRN